VIYAYLYFRAHLRGKQAHLFMRVESRRERARACAINRLLTYARGIEKQETNNSDLLLMRTGDMRRASDQHGL
jgi:hypothetical protein